MPGLLKPVVEEWNLTALSTKIAVEAQHGLIAQVLKDILFTLKPTPSSVNEIIDTAMAEE